MIFDEHMLDLDAERECGRIVEFLRDSVHRLMRRRGAVLGISGGVDSSVVLALCVRAFGPDRVTALIMPEKESDPDSERLARLLAQQYSVSPVLHDITAVLEAFGCYRLRDDAIRKILPDYEPLQGFKAKLVLPPGLLEHDTLNLFSLAIERPGGEQVNCPLPPVEFRQIVAASSFKQRARMGVLYYHAERQHYAVVGTPNKNEHQQGFFVKYGDGGSDLRPIVHLLKTQVYQLAEFLEVPAEIRNRPPTTDTYAASCTQQEFFFRIPFSTMDLVWSAMENGIPIEEVAAAAGLQEEQVRRVVADLKRKAETTEYLRMQALELGKLTSC